MQQLVEKIVSEIRNQGAISFARFMELALYCPVYGYYEKEGDTVGRRGDYYTSPSVGPLFGELLALQFAEWLRQMDKDGDKRVSRPSPAGVRSAAKQTAELAPRTPPREAKWQLVEAGAHRGELARDILRWLNAHEPELVRRIDYCLLEPSQCRRDWQRRTLAEFAAQVRWAKDLEHCGMSPSAGSSPTPNRRGVRGIIFSNELLDAMPVHRFGWEAAKGRWFEWGVTYAEGRLQWVRSSESGLPAGLNSGGNLQPLDVFGQCWSEELLQRLPDGFTIEFCPAANRWWAQAAGILQMGKLLTLDYGLENEEWVSAARTEGTLRAYYQHRLSADVLSRPGDQDITAHVNFSALCRAGESAGLTTEGLFSQEQFLTRIAARVFSGSTSFGQWTAQRTRQFQTLTHPNHLGRSFRVLMQSRQPDGA